MLVRISKKAYRWMVYLIANECKCLSFLESSAKVNEGEKEIFRRLVGQTEKNPGYDRDCIVKEMIDEVTGYYLADTRLENQEISGCLSGVEGYWALFSAKNVES